MKEIRITATYEAEMEERDDNDPTGLTSEAYDQLNMTLDEMGFTNVIIKAV